MTSQKNQHDLASKNELSQVNLVSSDVSADDAEEQEALRQEKNVRHMELMEADFDRLMLLPKRNAERDKAAEYYHDIAKTRSRPNSCEPETINQTLVVACLLAPQYKHYQSTLAKHMAKIDEEEIDGLFNYAEELIEFLPALNQKIETNESFMNEFYGREGYKKEVEKFKKLDLMEGAKRYKVLRVSLQQLQFKMNSKLTLDTYKETSQITHAENGRKFMKSLNEHKDVPKEVKGEMLVKIGLMTNDATLVSKAVDIADELKDKNKSAHIFATVKDMITLGQHKEQQVGQFLTFAKNTLCK